MTAAKIDRALLRMMPALCVLTPLMIFGLIYVLAVVPARKAAGAAEAEAEASVATLARMRAQSRNASLSSGPAASSRRFEVRTASELADAVKAVAGSHTALGVARPSVQIQRSAVTVTFDARDGQLDAFFSSLDAITGPYDVTTVDIVHKQNAPLARVMVGFLLRGEGSGVPKAPLAADASQRPEGEKRSTAPFSAAPEKSAILRLPSQQGPDPVVRTILYSSQQKSALVDGRVVRLGDRVGNGTVHAIAADTVVVVNDDGRLKRLALKSPGTRATKR
jgi:hypothetical protein